MITDVCIFVFFHYICAATPHLVKPPQDTTVPAGSLVVFECDATGEPDPVVQWLRDGIPVLASNKYQFAHDGSLIIQSVAHSDEGVYQCVASNAAGVTRAVARLQVTSKLANCCYKIGWYL